VVYGFDRRRKLVNLHPLVWLRSGYRWHLRAVCLVARHRLLVDVRLEALVEVVCADARNDNGHEEQDDGQNGKGGQRLAGWLVVLLAVQVCDVHADELEEEVGKRDEIDDDAAHHAGNRFAAHPKGSGKEQEKGDDEGGRSEDDLNRGSLFDDDEELDCEGEEEEEVELEQGNVNLAGVSVGFERTWVERTWIEGIWVAHTWYVR